MKAGVPFAKDFVEGAVTKLAANPLFRPAFHWRDLRSAPLHDFPLRDEILFQFAPPTVWNDVLEIGPGSGFTAYRLRSQFRAMTLADIAAESLETLRNELGASGRFDWLVADVASPGFAARLNRSFDVIYGLDEYISDPATCLRNCAEVLRPGGLLFFSYPNVPPPKGDGVTWFEYSGELERLIEAAGFARWEVFVVHIRPAAALVYSLLHEWPLYCYRTFRTECPRRPQTYDTTWAFRNRGRFTPFKVAIHATWLLIASVLQIAGPVFCRKPAPASLLGQQVVLTAWR